MMDALLLFTVLLVAALLSLWAVITWIARMIDMQTTDDLKRGAVVHETPQHDPVHPHPADVRAQAHIERADLLALDPFDRTEANDDEMRAGRSSPTWCARHSEKTTKGRTSAR